jgi:hypothetical protein
MSNSITDLSEADVCVGRNLLAREKLVSHRQTLQYYLISYLDILKSVGKHGGPIRVKPCYIICTATLPVSMFCAYRIDN